jgi:hypothetical protein
MNVYYYLASFDIGRQFGRQWKTVEDSGRQWKTVEYVCQHLGLIDLGSTKYVDASAKFMIEAFHTRM